MKILVERRDAEVATAKIGNESSRKMDSDAPLEIRMDHENRSRGADGNLTVGIRIQAWFGGKSEWFSAVARGSVHVSKNKLRSGRTGRGCVLDTREYERRTCKTPAVKARYVVEALLGCTIAYFTVDLLGCTGLWDRSRDHCAIANNPLPSMYD